MAIDMEEFRVKPGAHIRLDKIDPEKTPGYDEGKDEANDTLNQLTSDLEVLQERLYAEHKHGVLIILQGMDTSGKDGTIAHVFEGVNPQGVRVASFKAPSAAELEHDYLWRTHQKTPAKGEIVIFNRSHYEDVLVVRVHQLVSDKVWSKRYGQINDFERMLTDEGTTILKFYLHIDENEQRQRLIDRLKDPNKRWKFNPADLDERKLWNDYMHAYEDALSMTSTEWAPWYVIPANHKWFRNLLIATQLVETLKKMDPQPPVTMTEKDAQKYQAALSE